jgi:endonuclease III
MVSQKKIIKVITLISKEVKKFNEPTITQISRVTKHDPYRVLISCILSLRTKDEVTALASERLFALANTPTKMITLSFKQVEKVIYPVGFYRKKSRIILNISHALLKHHNGKVPHSIDQLLTFKGVGRKTANIVLTYGFRDPEGLPIDTHCHRVPNRLGWITTKTPDETEMRLREIIQKEYWMDFNDSFVIFGQNICKPISPLCSRCPVHNLCQKIGVKTSR